MNFDLCGCSGTDEVSQYGDVKYQIWGMIIQNK